MKREIDFYQEHYQLAAGYKNTIESSIERIMSYADPVSKFSTGKSDPYKRSPVHSAIMESRIAFKNFITRSLFGVKSKWAKADVIRSKLMQEYNNNLEKVEVEIDRLIPQMNTQTDMIFQYILNSNFEKEIGRAISDWGEYGTGCFQYIEQRSTVYPFRHQYVPLNELVFNEDFRGKPEIIFRHYFKKRPDVIRYLFPEIGNSFFEDLKDSDETIDLVECIMPYEDNSVKETDSREKVSYERILFTSIFDKVLFSEIKTYCPYTVARFSTLSNNPWGTGIGHICYDAYERLNFYEQIRARQAVRIVEPPLLLTGDKGLVDMLSLEPNARNWGGDGRAEIARADVINTTGTLIPVEQDIERFITIIKNAHFNNPLGSVDNRTTRATNEIQFRMEQFQQQFSDATSSLYEEILKPTYQKPKQILLEKDLIEPMEEETESFFQAQFVNTLTQSAELSEVESIIQMRQIAQMMFPNESEFIFNTDRTISKFVGAMGIDTKLIVPADERNMQLQARQEQMQEVVKQASLERNREETLRLRNQNAAAMGG